MTDALQRYLDPKVVERIGSLELQARRIVEGLISGRHRSPFFGQSVEFAQHREYVPGDDLRHIDWKVWAKSDRFYIKQFEEETNLRATLLLDSSESMAYGEGETNKFEYASGLAASLSFLMLRQSDSVGMVVFDEQVATAVPHHTTQIHLRQLLHAMTMSQNVRKTEMEKVLRQIADREQKRGLIILISDLLADRNSVLRGLRMLRRRKHDLIVLHVMHEDEIEFKFEGPTQFLGLESMPNLTCDPKALRDEYLASLNRYLQQIRKLCSQEDIQYRFVPTNKPMDAVLASLLVERSQR